MSQSMLTEKVQVAESSTTEKKGILFLCTAHSPFGKYEVYIRNEVKVLSKAFETIYMVPIHQSDELHWELPENVKAVKLNTASASTAKVIRKYGWQILMILLWEFADFSHWAQKWKNLFKKVRLLMDGAKRAERLEQWGQDQGIDISKGYYYSNWFVAWTESLGMLKMKGKISSFVARAHRYDLYLEAQNEGYIFFRPLHLKMVDEVTCISRAGYEYLKETYPKYKDKVSLSYLGVFDHGPGNMVKENETIHLVSCSNLLVHKRVNRIISIIKAMNVPVNWLHFGGGELFEELENEAGQLPENISWKFTGRVPNPQVMEYFQNNYIDFFVNVSQSEGLPVSIMEAVSFGVPVVATDVGGTREIVNEDTGILIPEEFDDHLVAKQIMEKLHKFHDPAFRKGVREYWGEYFDAQKNFQSFVQIIKSLK